MSEEPKEDILSKLVDNIFSLKKETIYLFLIFLLGAILRLIAAINIQPNADELHFVTHAVNFYSTGRLVTFEQSAGLWFGFTSLMYNLIGYTQLASRIASILFGSFSIFLIYLISKEFFDEKTSLIAAFLLSIAPFHIRSTVAEMDVMAIFFTLLFVFFSIKAIKSERNIYFALSGISIGLAIYTKVYPVLFLPSILLYFAYNKYKLKEKIITKKNIQLISILLAFTLVFCLPELIYNYSLYQEKGFLDLQFTKFLRLGEDKAAQYYSWLGNWNESAAWSAFLIPKTNKIDSSGYPLSIVVLKQLQAVTPFIFYTSLLSLLLLVLKKNSLVKEYSKLFILLILFAFPFLASSIALVKHFLFFELFMIPLTGSLLVSFINRSKNKNLTTIFFITLFCISLFLLSRPTTVFIQVFGMGRTAQIIDFRDKAINNIDLIVSDGRIYRGETFWGFYGKPFLEATVFLQLMNDQSKLPGKNITEQVYFVECVYDDCGWGTIKDQPEFNASMESLTDFFKKNGQLVDTIYEPNRENPYLPPLYGKKAEAVRIYKLALPMKSSIVEFAAQPKNWFMYDIGYEPKEKQFDYYYPTTFFQYLLDLLAHLIVKLSLILAIISPLTILYLIIDNNDKTTEI